MAKKIKEVPPSKIEFETFRKLIGYSLYDLEQKEPSCFNGDVRVRKYKVTIELIDEPKEVLYERLLNLWETCDNYRHKDPLRAEANKLGFELPEGSFRKREKREKK
jgi:hypothetical protein